MCERLNEIYNGTQSISFPQTFTQTSFPHTQKKGTHPQEGWQAQKDHEKASFPPPSFVRCGECMYIYNLCSSHEATPFETASMISRFSDAISASCASLSPFIASRRPHPYLSVPRTHSDTHPYPLSPLPLSSTYYSPPPFPPRIPPQSDPTMLLPTPCGVVARHGTVAGPLQYGVSSIF